LNNILNFHRLVNRECDNYKFYEYHLWWPKEVYLWMAIKEKFGIELTRNKINALLREFDTKEKPPEESLSGVLF